MTKDAARALAPIVAPHMEEGAAVNAPSGGKAEKTSAVSLFDAFDDVQALITTEEGGIDEEMRTEFEQALQASREVAAAKVDRCIQFHSRLKAEIEFHREEEGRIATHRKTVENALERYRKYLAFVVGQFGERKPKKKGSDELGPAALKGNTGSISLREGGSEAVVEDVEAIPPQFIKTSVTLTLDVWSELLDAYQDKHGEEARVNLLHALKVKQDVDLAAVKASIEGGTEVPGADLSFKDASVVVR